MKPSAKTRTLAFPHSLDSLLSSPSLQNAIPKPFPVHPNDSLVTPTKQMRLFPSTHPRKNNPKQKTNSLETASEKLLFS